MLSLEQANAISRTRKDIGLGNRHSQTQHRNPKKTLGFKVIAPPTELNFVAKVNLMAMDKRIETLLECTAVFNHDNE